MPKGKAKRDDVINPQNYNFNELELYDRYRVL